MDKTINVELAIERVATRVKEGGHDIPFYIPLSDSILIFDNTYGSINLIAKKSKLRDLIILN